MADQAPPSPSKPQDNSPSDDDLDADTLAMNALMGFSSFAPAATKKRRFNDIDDAFTGQTQAHPSSLPPKPPAPSSSGANSLPILPRAPNSVAGNVPAESGDGPEPFQPPPAAAHGGARNHGGGHGGSRDRKEPWWTEYYDPSSNENPWERLEQARGMEAAPGGWIASRSGPGGGGKASEARGGVTTV
ncbi:hypothetical protein B0T18DRAFT_216329 [Schizothecium vesticola]|uniref:Uncharacterized protein n=1 Tax=Schizothecium vesticola TaxID=314040 RepID=A0AA40EK38_9PEZI|nr:hypothetical protein B0T18DRAFT_216329 [Schizothecium vesticola]